MSKISAVAYGQLKDKKARQEGKDGKNNQPCS